jgi:hypothetical protein
VHPNQVQEQQVLSIKTKQLVATDSFDPKVGNDFCRRAREVYGNSQSIRECLRLLPQTNKYFK